MAERRGSRPLARRTALGDAFRPTLDRLEITHDAIARRAVAQIVGRLGREELPGPLDVLAQIMIVPTGPGRAWARRVTGRALWVVYQFDADEVTVLGVTKHAPVPRE